MQTILRFARGDSGATVVVRTSALWPDLRIVGEGQVVASVPGDSLELLDLVVGKPHFESRFSPFFLAYDLSVS